MRCKWQVEINDYATKVLEKHWPEVHRERDIRQCGSNNLERVDVIAGGFPCQDISYAGLGAGLDGERSGLFFEAIRLVRELRPQAVVLENVSALLTRGLDRVLGTLAEIGYDAQWHCIPAAYVGAPHIRERVFILAYSDGERFSGYRKTEVRESGKGKAFARWKKRNDRESLLSLCRRVGRGIEVCEHGRNGDGIPNRVDRLRGLGNAVVPQVAELVGRMVVDILTKQSLQTS